MDAASPTEAERVSIEAKIARYTGRKERGLKPELEQELLRKYPRLYRQRYMSMRATCMCWGFDVGDGWFHLLDNLSFKLTRIGEIYDIWVEATQVKEKYGTLHFYHGWQYGPSWVLPGPAGEAPRGKWRMPWLGGTKVRRLDPVSLTLRTVSDKELDRIARLIDKLVDDAEGESARTCEQCSMPGALCGHGWLTTLCRGCAKKLEEYYPEPEDTEEPKTEEATKTESEEEKKQ